jgi:hypothetical protein
MACSAGVTRASVELPGMKPFPHRSGRPHRDRRRLTRSVHRAGHHGRPARIVTLIVATAAVGVLAAACGDSPPATVSNGGSSNAGASTSSQLIAFSACMRSNGVPNYPDPTSSGPSKETYQQLGVTSSRFRAAQTACQHLLPNGGNGPTPAEVQRVEAQGLNFAHCMRHHGVRLPDPASTGRIPDPASVGIDQGSPQFQAANQACRKYRPPYMPSNAQYNAYARTHGS